MSFSFLPCFLPLRLLEVTQSADTEVFLWNIVLGYIPEWHPGKSRLQIENLRGWWNLFLYDNCKGELWRRYSWRYRCFYCRGLRGCWGASIWYNHNLGTEKTFRQGCRVPPDMPPFPTHPKKHKVLLDERWWKLTMQRSGKFSFSNSIWAI